LAQAAAPLLLLLAVLAVLRPAVTLPHLRKRRRRKRVRSPSYHDTTQSGANTTTEKEESDEDMGFGLFD
jgi:ribosomal protein L12E/L44/L45/RPP1/RPP2